MAYIKKVYINGFKKFHKLELDFKDKKNIIVGENERGKSTILEAIDIIVNQRYKNSDKYIVKELLNQEQKSKFKENPKIENLPKIYMELELCLSNDDTSIRKYYGTENKSNKETSGIVFKCEFNEEYLDDLLPSIELGNIPYEYYILDWKTFSGEAYTPYRKGFNTILIDSSRLDSSYSFNYYNKSLFHAKHELEDRLNIKHQFRDKLSGLLDNTDINNFESKNNNDKIKFGINEKKVILENILTIYQNEIPIENKGKGMENIIKTEMALERENFSLDTVLLEEPENHLSYSNLLYMIENLVEKSEESQLILTTHESLIASRLGLQNIIWLSNEGEAISLEKIKKDTADFFMRADDSKFLQFLLAEKVILVEGPTEYLLIPKLYEQTYNRKLENDNITIISCGGISYKRYLTIAETIGKKTCVITDNDEKEETVEEIKEYNKDNEKQQIFTDENIDNWTWEICFYKENNAKLEKIIEIKEGSKYSFKGRSYEEEPYLGKMLNKKVDTAFVILKDKSVEWQIPEYVREALEWIR